MPRIVHFEVHADDPARAAKFYTDVFGWEIKKWDGPVDYWMVMTGDKTSEQKGREGQGIDGGLMQRQGKSPQGNEPVTAFVCTAEVDSVDEYVEKINAAGGSIAVEKMAIPGVGWIAYCKDTEGNTFGLMQPDESAK